MARPTILLGTTGWAVSRVVCRRLWPREPVVYTAQIEGERLEVEAVGDGLFRVPWPGDRPPPSHCAFVYRPKEEPAPMPKKRIHIELDQTPQMLEPARSGDSDFSVAVKGDRPVPVPVLTKATGLVDGARGNGAIAAHATVSHGPDGWHIELRIRPSEPRACASLAVTWEA